MDTKTMLLELAAQPGLPGSPEAIAYAEKLLQPYGKVAISPLGSVVCTVREPKEGGVHILLDAHLDEIGLVVTYIEENGFLRVAQYGGTDPRVLAASRVEIHTSGGRIHGVICSVPPHLSAGQENSAPTADKIYIDTGLSTEGARERVFPGDRVTFTSPGSQLLNHRLTSKALDNRAGCVSLIKALEYLEGAIPVGLTVIFSTMEESSGYKGAATSSFTASPTHALVVDVTFGDSPDTPSHKGFKLGSGPAIGFAPVLNHQLSTQLVGLCVGGNIPYNLEVMGGATGTNSDAITVSRGGVPTGLVSIPLRYMHMPIETIQLKDVEYTARLIAAWVKEMGVAQ